ncbi:carbohydrate esterase family 16 protein [Hydnum rufescens UP504]|uniref:Carbohydrate esterase family 16 protein n=1 Tax=Hydnum rufescens UP504 TaxID=1448309 RepID=A0A9P6B8S0_9AGAM|nr:carbohydrate esterase family 16 protein [Hydnum rufescens UP504]
MLSPTLPISIIRPSWPGLEGIHSLVILGDSYSAPPYSESDDGSDSWIQHLMKIRTRRKSSSSPFPHPSIYNYAIPGATVSDRLSFQLPRFFADFPKKESPTSTPSLNPDETLYVIWLGINDCGCTSADELEDILDYLSDIVHTLYVKAGARNFLLVDVPPLDRSPGALEMTRPSDLKETCDTWNSLLSSYIRTFAAETSQATILLFSAHAVLTGVLDDFVEFDFSESDVEEAGGGIWLDEIHLTSAVHSILAESLERALEALPTRPGT